MLKCSVFVSTSAYTPLLQTALEVNRLPTDKISHFFVEVPLCFHLYILPCLIINDMIFGACGGCFTPLKISPQNYRGCEPHSDAIPTARAKRKMLIMFSVFEQQPLQRPVKIALSVYLAFDPVGNTQERQ